MRTLLVLGAGLSSNSLLTYLSDHALSQDWETYVVDVDYASLCKKVKSLTRVYPLEFDATNRRSRRNHIRKADLVISMLPASFHYEVAIDCVDLKKNLITPSYISKEMRSLDEKAKDANICIMNEIGVDPGIDHMSACRILDDLRKRKAEIISFKSFCGGLVAPESDNNPWNYKFTWNPRNLVVAGQGSAAQFIEQNQYKYIPYGQLFRRTEVMSIEGFGDFEGYANRNSLQYRQLYHLDTIPTIYRGTLRRVGYGKAWDVFVQLGLTDDSFKIEHSETLTPRAFLNAFLPYKEITSVEDKLKKYFVQDDDEVFEKIKWLGLFEDEQPIGLKDASPAQLLQKILLNKWSLDPEDKDMLVMYHEFEYVLEGKNHRIKSSMVHIGKDQYHTAMANTVGLPVAICAKNILNGTISEKGVTLPLHQAVYQPILNELESYGISFEEKEEVLN